MANRNENGKACQNGEKVQNNRIVGRYMVTSSVYKKNITGLLQYKAVADLV